MGYGPPPGYSRYGMAPLQPAPMVPRCATCGFQGHMIPYAKVSTGGWVIFALLLLFCFPLCFLGLLIRDKGLQCPHCQQLVGALR